MRPYKRKPAGRKKGTQNGEKESNSPNSPTEENNPLSEESLIETPIGRGSGTRLEHLSGNPPFHGFESLEDIEQDYNNVLYQVELFGSQFTQEKDWISQLDTKYESLLSIIDDLLKRCSNSSYPSSKIKCLELHYTLSTHHHKLQQKADRHLNNPNLRRMLALHTQNEPTGQEMQFTSEFARDIEVEHRRNSISVINSTTITRQDCLPNDEEDDLHLQLSENQESSSYTETSGSRQVYPETGGLSRTGTSRQDPKKSDQNETWIVSKFTELSNCIQARLSTLENSPELNQIPQLNSQTVKNTENVRNLGEQISKLQDKLGNESDISVIAKKVSDLQPLTRINISGRLVELETTAKQSIDSQIDMNSRIKVNSDDIMQIKINLNDILQRISHLETGTPGSCNADRQGQSQAHRHQVSSETSSYLETLGPRQVYLDSGGFNRAGTSGIRQEITAPDNTSILLGNTRDSVEYLNSINPNQLFTSGQPFVSVLTTTQTTLSNSNNTASNITATHLLPTTTSTVFNPLIPQVNVNRRTNRQPDPGTLTGPGRDDSSFSGDETSFDEESFIDEEEGNVPNSLRYSHRILKREIRNLRSLINKHDVNQETDSCILLDLHKNILPVVKKERRSCSTALEKYSSQQGHSIATCDWADQVICNVQIWEADLNNEYRARDLQFPNMSQSIYDDLKRFGKDSQLNIYEFLKRFEALTRDKSSQKDKANLLYERYLDESIQLELVGKSDDFLEIKKWLIRKFGDIKTMTDGLVKPILKKTMPGNSASYNQQLDYLRTLNSVIQKINELPNTSDVSKQSVENHIYSSEFMMKLVNHLPASTMLKLFDKLDDENLDDVNIQGKAAFKILSKVVFKDFTNCERALKVKESGAYPVDTSDKIKPRIENTKRSANAVEFERVKNNPSFSEESTTAEVHYQNSQKGGKDEDQRQKTKYKFPCPLSPLDKHDHELGTCTRFFELKPDQRQKYSKRICFTCLGPRNRCQRGCINDEDKRLQGLICTGCKEWAKNNSRSPHNILLCKSTDHEKPDTKELEKALKIWLKDFIPENLKKPIIVASHCSFIGLSKSCANCKAVTRDCNCDNATCSSQPDPRATVPTINTQTGKTISVKKHDIIKESEEDSHFIMQVLNMRGKDCLTFFDTGANNNLIDGELAEEINLKVVDSTPSTLGIVGGGRLSTRYGSYKVHIGPTPEEKYQELLCQGIFQVTSTFNHYDLTNVNNEVRKSKQLPAKEPLPNYIGGSKVHLLIGIKNPNVIPKLLFTLDSGIGVYQSVFPDKFGSRICYGGPHNVFTLINNKANGNVNHFSTFFIQLVNQYQNSLYPGISESLEEILMDGEVPISCPEQKTFIYKMKVNNESDFSVHPTPLNYTHFEDHGTIEDNELDEELGDDHSRASLETRAEPVWSCSGCHHIKVHKAKLNTPKNKDPSNEYDTDNIVNYRCPDCANCSKCKMSGKSKNISLKERLEQDIIEKSVSVDIENEKVFVELPFTRDPEKFLTEKHHGTDNYSQALRMYKRQCKKPDKIKDGMRKVHADLVKRGFIKRLDELSSTQQKTIEESGFKHYHPWNTVEKPDSISTPVRMVVDPSMSGLNEILAKGENLLALIHEIILRSRCKLCIWTSDISKLYNQLHLKDSALPYSLLLYQDEMDPEKSPDVWVMVRAWYGVKSTGNQSGYALDHLAELKSDEFPLAFEVLMSSRYVDDILGNAETEEEVDAQIYEVTSVLKKGGFGLKFVAKSGYPPPPDASSDGETLRILGYKWSPEQDELSPAFEEVNFNKKRRGAKKPNVFPVVSSEDVTKLLSSIKISRRIVVSKIAEIFDPIGLWEPYKLQLKLEQTTLNGVDWDLELNEELQHHWSERFKEFVELPNLKTPRCVVPVNAVDPTKMRLVCVSDAAVGAGGTAIYAGFLLHDGSYSCMLLTSKSKLFDMSIPRNELSAIVEMSKLAFVTKKALGDLVQDVLYFTDSTIAMCWCQNTSKRLKTFVHFRVAAIRTTVEWTIGPYEVLPLYHIDGTANVADMLTKPMKIKPLDLGPNSLWMNGYKWMTLPLDQMPITKFSDLSYSDKEVSEVLNECFLEPLIANSSVAGTVQSKCTLNSFDQSSLLGPTNQGVNHCTSCTPEAFTRFPWNTCYGKSDAADHCDNCDCIIFFTAHSAGGRDSQLSSNIPFNIIKLGWVKTIRFLKTVIMAYQTMIHKTHGACVNQKIKDSLMTKCHICSILDEDSKWDDVEALCEWLAKGCLFREESKRLKILLSKKKLEQFIFTDMIYFYPGRLSDDNPISEKDVEVEVFYDNQSINSVLPVVGSDSPMFFAYAIYVHSVVQPHAGVEITYREISKVMHVINNPRRIIQRIRQDCPRCRLIMKKTVELEMAKHAFPRTQIAPVFYNVMIDTVFGFKGQPYKQARKGVKIYALVIVCLFTSATNILALEGLETQDVIQAIERHSSRYGVPANAYVDNGTQLVNLQNTGFSLRDLNAHVYDSMGLTVKISNAKSHEERGRVESKVKVMRSMLEKLAIKSDTRMTCMQWETLFAKVANMIDDVPIAKGNSSNIHDLGWEIITPNRLKLGRNNFRSLEGSFSLKGSTAQDLLDKNKRIQQIWYQTFIDRLHHLIPKPAKWNNTERVSVDDICIFIYNENPSMNADIWKLGRVVEVSVRKVKISFPVKSVPGKLPKMKFIERSPRDISIISAADDINLNSWEYFEKISQRVS